MPKYYAVCNANGPISARLSAASAEAAIAEFEAANVRSWIDEPRMDAEDDFDFCGEGMSEEEFDAELEARGCTLVADLAESVNAYSGCGRHILNGWQLWASEEEK